jgi:hypothetical protein
MSRASSRDSESIKSYSTSQQQQRWQPRSRIAIFIHALHLLDLDTKHDFPNITEATYSSAKTQNLQARIKATEWSLYNLFNIYSPKETSTRLTSFWPPNTPLQAKNLRAALFKWLTDLKASGVLPRDVVLRKTMLDECKGDKFEEVLARFAMLVLRRKMESNGDDDEAVLEFDPDMLVARILSYRSFLQKVLDRRKELDAKAKTYTEQLDKVKERIESSTKDLVSSFTSRGGEGKDALSPEDLQQMRAEVDKAFVNAPQWSRFIFEGTFDPTEFEDGNITMPEWPFISDTITEQTSGLADDVNAPMTALMNLVSRYEERAMQLQELQSAVDAKMSQDRQRNAPVEEIDTDSSSMEKPGPRELRFNRHQDLVLRV